MLNSSAKETAIGWSATLGLIPGYRHDNDPTHIAARRALLVQLWCAAMEETLSRTGFSVSAVMTDAVVLYPVSGGCPVGGEQAIMLTGNSNPKYVGAERHAAFCDAVRATVRRVQEGMEQTTVRIEFTHIDHSVYSRFDG